MKQFFRKFYKSWYFEITLGVFLVLGLLYVMNMSVANEWIGAFIHVINLQISAFLTGLNEFITSSSGKKILLGTTAGLVLIVLIAWRIIWRLRGSDRFSSTSCPKCGNPLVRIKSHEWQRFIRPILPVRRFYCRSCGWKGFRVKSSEGTPLNVGGTGKRPRIHVDKIS